MSDELSKSTIYDLSIAWENDDVPQTFEAAVSDGTLKAEGLNPLNPDALNDLVSKGLIRVSEAKEGKVSIKLLPALHRAAADAREADKDREKQLKERERLWQAGAARRIAGY